MSSLTQDDLHVRLVLLVCGHCTLPACRGAPPVCVLPMQTLSVCPPHHVGECPGVPSLVAVQGQAAW
jgi:hypothetical protein